MKPNVWSATIAIILFLILSGFISRAVDAQISKGPSFSCASPSKIEALICADPELAARDRAMALLYAEVRTNVLDTGPSQQQAEQIKWLKYRDSGECNMGTLGECLTRTYDHRLEELAVSALFRKPTEALVELTRVNPNGAPLYEAMYRYATIDDVGQRTEVVEKLITPAFDKLNNGSSWTNILFKDAPDARTAASADKSFSLFLNVAASNGFTLTLPCAAIVQRPGLMAALGALYGSSLDGRLISTDCSTMLPELPNVTRLAKDASQAQPFCQGTIRFTISRYNAQLRVAVRLHRTEFWEAGNRRDSSHNENEAPFRIQHRSSIEAAQAELAAYYTRVFKVPTDIANADAREAINAVVVRAFYHCGG